MAKATAEMTIRRSTEEVWSTIGRFDDLSWFPGLATCVAEGDRRFVTMQGSDRQLEERLFHHSDADCTYSYGVLGLPGHRSTITVAAAADASLVTYDLELDDGHDELLATVAGNYRAVLEHLRCSLEG